MERTGTGVVPGVVRIPVLKTLLALVLQMIIQKQIEEQKYAISRKMKSSYVTPHVIFRY